MARPKHENIIRRPDRAAGGITAAEKARLDEHTKLWIRRSLRTEQIEPEKIVPAIEDLYAAAGLKRPRVIIVPSPIVMAFAGGFASAIWSLKKNGDATDAATDAATSDATYAVTIAATSDATRTATDAATDAATSDATYAATRTATDAATIAATDAATIAATSDATYAATIAATYAATIAATSAATIAATSDATSDATYAATSDATYAATDAAPSLMAKLAYEISPQHGDLLLQYAREWYSSYQGGNMWAAYDCYLSSYRDVLGLRLPIYEKYDSWERCAINGGFRFMHEEFCLVCDFPEVLRVETNGTPHCEDGPSHRWRDGWSLWHIHGVVVDEQIVMRPETQTVEQIEREPNEEVRRIRIERYGWLRYLAKSGARIINERQNDIDNQRECLVESKGGMRRLIVADPSTARRYALGVPAEIQTCEAAQAWLNHGLPISHRS